MPATSPSEPLPAPAWLPDGARVVWEEIEPRLRLVGRTGPEWREILANYCVTAAELRRAGVALDSEPLTRDGPHGPVVHPLVSVVTKLRGTLAALGGKLGIDARAGGAAAMPLPDGLPLSKMEEWRRRHPA
jgi:P27 family predicted phage terminase small subunit